MQKVTKVTACVFHVERWTNFKSESRPVFNLSYTTQSHAGSTYIFGRFHEGFYSFAPLMVEMLNKMYLD